METKPQLSVFFISASKIHLAEVPSLIPITPVVLYTDTRTPKKQGKWGYSARSGARRRRYEVHRRYRSAQGQGVRLSTSETGPKENTFIAKNWTLGSSIPWAKLLLQGMYKFSLCRKEIWKMSDYFKINKWVKPPYFLRFQARCSLCRRLFLPRPH
jgi:hypothetical protein